MSEDVVSFVVERVDDLLKIEKRFLYGVCEQIERVQNGLKRMPYFLKDADARQHKREIIDLVEETRDLAYHVEDILEISIFKIASSRRRRSGGTRNILLKFASILNEGIAVHKLRSEIETIINEIRRIRTTFQKYGIGSSSSVSSEEQPQSRKSYSQVVDEDFAGSDADMEILVKMLVNENENRRVVSICGVDGIGKTTLAQKVYNHIDVQRHFDCFAWVCISQQWKRRDILLEILIKLERKQIVNVKREKLKNGLIRIQQEKKCLVVLDDIWSKDAWNDLEPAFPGRGTRTKILLTSPDSGAVALHADPNAFVLQLRFLTEEESWELLQKKTFPSDTVTTIDKEMETLGKKMVQMCPSLPLAIVLLGGLLATKHSSKEWEKVYQTIGWYKSSLPYGRLQEVVDFSYHDLPYRLKQCYLFFGNFPENSEIRAEKLYNLWIAEGIISKTGPAEGETMMATAEHYLGELAQRGIVQVRLKKYCHTKRFKSCQLHNKMRGLCLSNVKRENFLEVIDFRHGNMPVGSFFSYSSSKIRRLAIYLDNEINTRLPRSKEHLRSVLFFHTYFASYWKKMVKFSDFNLLRILDLEGFDFVEEELPKEIGNLTSLRYMSLRDCKIKTLPSFIGYLRYLQILDLRVKHVDHLYVPNVLREMEDLRHLYLPTSLNSEQNDLQLNGLSNLETLVNFDCCVCHVNDLSRLSNLRKLKATISDNPNPIGGLLNAINQQNRPLCFSLSIYYCSFSSEKNSLLQELLGCRHLYKLEMSGKISGLQENLKYCTSLTKLTLSHSELERDPMPILENLSLRRLILSIDSFLGTDMVCSTGGFSQLESLVLKGLPNLKTWEVREKAMPKLSHLRISGSKNLTMIPDGLRYVTTLQELEIFWMPEAFVNGLRANLDKVSCVPVIRFHNTIIDSQHDLTTDVLDSQMEIWHRTHYNRAKGWSFPLAGELYDEMCNLQSQPTPNGPLTDDKICESVLRKRPGYVPLWHKTHYDPAKGWSCPLTEELCDEMLALPSQSTSENSTPLTEDEICERVLGRRPGYVRMWHRTHYNPTKGWSCPLAKELYDKMLDLQMQRTPMGSTPPTNDEIHKRILGKRPAYVQSPEHGEITAASSSSPYVGCNETEDQTNNRVEDIKTLAH